MSISSIYTPVAYNGDNSTTAFPYNFLIFQDSDIVVTETIIATGVETIKTLTTDYTVTGEGTGSGTVTATSPPASTVRWVISRAVERTQEADYVENDPFPAETHEAALDKLTAIAQELDAKIARTLHQPDGDATSVGVLPSAVDRAGKYLSFDSSGDPTAVTTIDEDNVVVSAFMETVLDDASSANARTTLEVSEMADSEFRIKGSGDGTKKLAFEVDTISAATTRTITVPDANLTLPSVTAAGDLVLASSSGVLTKLAVGAAGTVPMSRAAATNKIAYAAVLNKVIYGFTYSNNAGDATNDLDIAAGGAMDATGAYFMVGSALTKRSDANWVVGDGQGGLDTGAVGNSDYYIWCIVRSDTGVVDYLYSLSSTAPTMPANYDFKRLIGWFKRSGGAIVTFTTYETEGGGLEFAWKTPTLDINSAALTTSRLTAAVKVPLNFSTTAHIRVSVDDAGVAVRALIMCPDETDTAASETVAPLFNIFSPATSFTGGTELRIRTSATGTISARAASSVDAYRVVTNGFRWARRN